MIKITPAEITPVRRITCPECGSKLRGAAIKPESDIHGFVFQCHACKKLWELTAEPADTKQ